MPEGEIRLMVKGAALASRFALGSGRSALRGEAEPLLTSIGAGELGAAPDAEAWQLLRFAADDAPSPWDLCHAIMRGGEGFPAVPGASFAEPDLEQRWPFGDPLVEALRLAEGCPATGAPQNPSFPRGPQSGPHAMWHATPDHGQFGQIAGIFDQERAPRVRIAQLDTGFDPHHQTLPARLRHDLQRNFVRGERPDDARDRQAGFVNKAPGHGTGTMGILAGRTTGAAPWAEVIPLRVANAVVLFSNSAIAQALDHVHRLCADPQTFVHVVTMSMGGLACRAWAEAVNALYDRGVTMVTAAGNNFGNLPTRFLVYPARFNRVTAACGVMADLLPYADLGLRRMAGNYGPASAMRTALAASTPNMPWPRIGCAGIVDSDGAGTSAATPQVAAAAALWIARHHDAWAGYPEGWMRVEAVRRALFATAVPGRNAHEVERLGIGRLRAADALNRALPAAAGALTREAPDSTRFGTFRMMLGLGLHGLDPGQAEMLELEALQLSQSAGIEALLPEGPDVPPEDPAELVRLREALADAPGASQALKAALGRAADAPSVPGADLPLPGEDAIRRRQIEHALDPPLDPPPRRRLQVFAFDPTLGTDLATLGINHAVISIPWEPLEPGPVGGYLEVIDIDPPSRVAYAPVDLDAPALLARDGLAPSESDPRFHQQMVYAVAMRTIEAFEEALGRAALWAPHVTTDAQGRTRSHFVEKLRIHPHVLREANAYYSPGRQALLFGYFESRAEYSAGELVFTCLSHDIIAHEVTHALLDGLHRRMREPTNPDVLAFHEAFADAVALFQHFSLPEALRAEIARTRGDLGQEGLLGALAQQFGQALHGHGALRDSLGGHDEDGVWRPRPARLGDYADARKRGPHALGAVLVAALFDAFLQIYRRRAYEVVRLATGGSGVLPEGELAAGIVTRLADEAARASRHVLHMVIRALDYCPPVDITFGEYLRALVTADRDMVPVDDLHYRVAFVTAFRARGIRPEGVRHVSPDALLWEEPPEQAADLGELLGALSLGWTRGADRAGIARLCEENATKVQQWLDRRATDEVLAGFGLIRVQRAGQALTIAGVEGRLSPLAVQSVRPARRIGPDGDTRRDLVIEITQDWTAGAIPGLRFSGGATLLVDLETARIRYAIRKRVANARRVREQMGFVASERGFALGDPSFGLARRAGPFALLHAGPVAWEGIGDGDR
jgi:hypothetical protein